MRIPLPRLARWNPAYTHFWSQSLAGFCCRSRSMITLAWTPPRLCASRSLEALHLRLFEPGAVNRTSRPSPTSGATIAQPSGPFSVSSCCCAGGSTSRTRIAGRGWNPHQGSQQQGPQFYADLVANSSSARPTSGWTTICGGSTKAMSRRAERAAARARKHDLHPGR
jgi:hypothetical protein